VEDVVCYSPALGNTCSLVEVPVDAEINPALTIFLFGLRQGRKAARHIGTNITLVIFGCAVEFVGNKSKADTIGPIEATDCFENCAAESGVARRISREGWSKVWPDQIARGGAQRHEGGIASCGIIAITRTGRRGSGI